ncbi:MAG: phage replisome organizer N-terminal domain-containing protein [Clostridia bacterium]|nr:phage replisome organizer N-terminal domain-containing protein [Clostridia bacterium]
MAEVKWIKIVTDIFGNRKIKQIEAMPEADTILVVWFKLLCLAGNINESGLITITKDIPYTDEMLANEFRRPLNTVRLALSTFEQFGMIEIVDNILCVSNWEKYQNTESMEKIREKTRERVSRHRQKQKELASHGNVTCNATVTQSNALERDKEEDIDKDKEEDIEGVGKAAPRPSKSDYGFYQSTYNSLCGNLRKCTALTEKRKKAIREFEKQMGKDAFEEVCHKANESAFCTGANDRGWRADFDFLIRADKATNILEGKYDGKEMADGKASRPAGQCTGRAADEKWGIKPAFSIGD